MKIHFTLAEIGALIVGLLFVAANAFAVSGACSSHGGVDCSAGPDSDGSVICMDGWRDSSVSYDSMVKCEGYTYPSAPGPIAEPTPVQAPEPDISSTFSDVPSTYRYQDAVEYMKENGIVDGYADGTYRPDNKINRAEFTKILMEYKYPNDPMTERNCFNDAGDEWYTPYVCLAKNKGIIGGYPDGTFRPEQNITVPEALKIVLLANGDTIPEVGGEWFQKYINYADSRGLRPDEWEDLGYTITRGEMAEVVQRLNTANAY